MHFTCFLVDSSPVLHLAGETKTNPSQICDLHNKAHIQKVWMEMHDMWAHLYIINLLVYDAAVQEPCSLIRSSVWRSRTNLKEAEMKINFSPCTEMDTGSWDIKKWANNSLNASIKGRPTTLSVHELWGMEIPAKPQKLISDVIAKHLC